MRAGLQGVLVTANLGRKEQAEEEEEEEEVEQAFGRIEASPG
jgi:hypothetical protein